MFPCPFFDAEVRNLDRGIDMRTLDSGHGIACRLSQVLVESVCIVLNYLRTWHEADIRMVKINVCGFGSS